MTPGQTYAYFEDMGMKDIVEKVEKVDLMTVRFVLKKPEAPFMADMAMDFASILSAEYADKMMAAKTPDVIDREPIGTKPVPVRLLPEDAVIRYKAFDSTGAGGRRSTTSSTRPTTPPYASRLKTGECHVIFEAGRRRVDEE
jgi:dipeptide transport system substrate-binding protein